ncbi:MAG TPA: hypothetical protein VLY85_02730 [Thermoplasmata archaeon]|nr:hypothetical protein [Thermoplasmata archaeon]
MSGVWSLEQVEVATLLLGAAAVGAGGVWTVRVIADPVARAGRGPWVRPMAVDLLRELGIGALLALGLGGLTFGAAYLFAGPSSAGALVFGFFLGAFPGLGIATLAGMVGALARWNADRAREADLPRRAVRGGGDAAASIGTISGGTAVLGLLACVAISSDIRWPIAGLMLGALVASVPVAVGRPSSLGRTDRVSATAPFEGPAASRGRAPVVAAYETLVLAASAATLLAFESPLLRFLEPTALLLPVFVASLVSWSPFVGRAAMAAMRPRSGALASQVAFGGGAVATVVLGSAALVALNGPSLDAWAPYFLGGIAVAAFGTWAAVERSGGRTDPGRDEPDDRGPARPPSRALRGAAALVPLLTVSGLFAGAFAIGGQVISGTPQFVELLGWNGVLWATLAMAASAPGVASLAFYPVDGPGTGGAADGPSDSASPGPRPASWSARLPPILLGATSVGVVIGILSAYVLVIPSLGRFSEALFVSRISAANPYLWGGGAVGIVLTVAIVLFAGWTRSPARWGGIAVLWLAGLVDASVLLGPYGLVGLSIGSLATLTAFWVRSEPGSPADPEPGPVGRAPDPRRGEPGRSPARRPPAPAPVPSWDTARAALLSRGASVLALVLGMLLAGRLLYGGA